MQGCVGPKEEVMAGVAVLSCHWNGKLFDLYDLYDGIKVCVQGVCN